jgi:hypothetical protein
VGDYFASYPEFDYNPALPGMPQLFHLRLSQDWDRVRMAAETKQLQCAYVRDFELHYGNDPSSLKSWRALFRALRMPRPHNELQARKVSTVQVKESMISSVPDLVPDYPWCLRQHLRCGRPRAQRRARYRVLECAIPWQVLA